MNLKTEKFKLHIMFVCLLMILLMTGVLLLDLHRKAVRPSVGQHHQEEQTLEQAFKLDDLPESAPQNQEGKLLPSQLGYRFIPNTELIFAFKNVLHTNLILGGLLAQGAPQKEVIQDKTAMQGRLHLKVLHQSARHFVLMAQLENLTVSVTSQRGPIHQTDKHAQEVLQQMQGRPLYCVLSCEGKWVRWAGGPELAPLFKFLRTILLPLPAKVHLNQKFWIIHDQDDAGKYSLKIERIRYLSPTQVELKLTKKYQYIYREAVRQQLAKGEKAPEMEAYNVPINYTANAVFDISAGFIKLLGLCGTYSSQQVGRQSGETKEELIKVDCKLNYSLRYLKTTPLTHPPDLQKVVAILQKHQPEAVAKYNRKLRALKAVQVPQDARAVLTQLKQLYQRLKGLEDVEQRALLMSQIESQLQLLSAAMADPQNFEMVKSSIEENQGEIAFCKLLLKAVGAFGSPAAQEYLQSQISVLKEPQLQAYAMVVLGGTSHPTEETVAYVREQFDAPAPALKQAVLIAFGNLRSQLLDQDSSSIIAEEMTRQLGNALNNNTLQGNARANAIRQLGLAPSPAGEELLLKLAAGNATTLTRESVAQALAVYDSKRATNTLLSFLQNDRDASVRRAGAQALLTKGDEPRVRRALLQALHNDQDPEVRFKIAEILGNFRKDPSLIQALQETYRGDANQRVKTMAFYSLRNLGVLH